MFETTLYCLHHLHADRCSSSRRQLRRQEYSSSFKRTFPMSPWNKVAKGNLLAWRRKSTPMSWIPGRNMRMVQSPSVGAVSPGLTPRTPSSKMEGTSWRNSWWNWTVFEWLDDQYLDEGVGEDGESVNGGPFIVAPVRQLARVLINHISTSCNLTWRAEFQNPDDTIPQQVSHYENQKD